MFDIQSLFSENHPDFYKKHPLLADIFIAIARFLWMENEFKALAIRHKNKQGVELINEGFRYINFDFSIPAGDLDKIPKTGPVVLIANHPVGYLDGMGLLKVISSVRPDLRLTVNFSLHKMLGMKDLTIPVDNFKGTITRQSLKIIKKHLENQGLLIIFPSGAVSAKSRSGEVRDREWNPSFLRFAREYNAPVMPVYIHGTNSNLFYFMVILVAPLAKKLLMVRELLQMKLIREMFSRHRNTRMPMLFGEPISVAEIDHAHADTEERTAAIRQRLYALKKRVAEAQN